MPDPRSSDSPQLANSAVDTTDLARRLEELQARLEAAIARALRRFEEDPA